METEWTPTRVILAAPLVAATAALLAWAIARAFTDPPDSIRQSGS